MRQAINVVIEPLVKEEEERKKMFIQCSQKREKHTGSVITAWPLSFENMHLLKSISSHVWNKSPLRNAWEQPSNSSTNLMLSRSEVREILHCSALTVTHVMSVLILQWQKTKRQKKRKEIPLVEQNRLYSTTFIPRFLKLCSVHNVWVSCRHLRCMCSLEWILYKRSYVSAY